LHRRGKPRALGGQWIRGRRERGEGGRERTGFWLGGSSANWHTVGAFETSTVRKVRKRIGRGSVPECAYEHLGRVVVTIFTVNPVPVLLPYTHHHNNTHRHITNITSPVLLQTCRMPPVDVVWMRLSALCEGAWPYHVCGCSWQRRVWRHPLLRATDAATAPPLPLPPCHTDASAARTPTHTRHSEGQARDTREEGSRGPEA
jgi:hypothetical protein